MELKECLSNFNFKLLTEFTPKQQKHLSSCLNLPPNCNLTVYTKVVEQMIEFSNDNNEKLYSTVLRFASFVILSPNGAIFDKFISPITIYRIRNAYEEQTVIDIIDDLFDELETLDTFLPETEDNCHEA